MPNKTNMMKCSFIVKENDNISEVVKSKTQEEINGILIDEKYFSIKVVDEYIFLDKKFTKEEQEQLVLPHLIAKGNERLK